MTDKKKQRKITELFPAGSLSVITGSNESGKTRLAMGMVADCAIDEGKGALYMPLNKDAVECGSKMAEVHSRVRLNVEGKTKVSQEQWDKLLGSVEALSDAPVYLSDMEAGSIRNLLREVKKFAAKKVKLVVIDNVCLLRGRPAGRKGETLCGAFKKLAKDANTAVVLVTPSYNRETDGCADKVLELEGVCRKRKAR